MSKIVHPKLWRLEVVWRDSYVELSSWTPVKRLVKNRQDLESTAVSVGFVLADDEKGVMLAGSVQGGNATGVVCIPPEMVVSRRRLR
jgi:hypothetical protein